MIRRYAACLGLLGFSAAIFCGLWAGNPVQTILLRALRVMVALVFMGLAVGWVGQAVVGEYLRRYEEHLPSGESEDQPGEPAQDAGQDDDESQQQAA